MVKRELRWCIHPMTLIYFAALFLALVPNFPYYLILAAAMLGIYFMNAKAQDNGDDTFLQLMPVTKSDMMKSHVFSASVIEIIFMLLLIPFAAWYASVGWPDNQVGIYLNTAFFGLGFILFGLFNLVFFDCRYRLGKTADAALGYATLTYLLCIFLTEVLKATSPIGAGLFGSTSASYTTARIIFLIIGILVYLILSIGVVRLTLGKKMIRKIPHAKKSV